MDMDADVDMDHVQTGMFSGGSSASDCESWQAGRHADCTGQTSESRLRERHSSNGPRPAEEWARVARVSGGSGAGLRDRGL